MDQELSALPDAAQYHGIGLATAKPNQFERTESGMRIAVGAMAVLALGAVGYHTISKARREAAMQRSLAEFGKKVEKTAEDVLKHGAAAAASAAKAASDSAVAAAERLDEERAARTEARARTRKVKTAADDES